MSRALISNLLEVVGLTAASVGIAVWIHPGAGLLAAGLSLALLGIATDSDTPNEGDQ